MTRNRRNPPPARENSCRIAPTTSFQERIRNRQLTTTRVALRGGLYETQLVYCRCRSGDHFHACCLVPKSVARREAVDWYVATEHGEIYLRSRTATAERRWVGTTIRRWRGRRHCGNYDEC